MRFLLTLIFILSLVSVVKAEIIIQEKVKVPVTREDEPNEKGFLIYKICVDGKKYVMAYSYGLSVQTHPVAIEATNQTCKE